jgi:phosphoglycolate phosphatase
MLHKHLSNYKHIIWDWNGTLVNDIAITQFCLNRQLEKKNLPPMEIPELRKRFHFPVQSFYTAIGLLEEGQDFSQLNREFHQSYNEKRPHMALYDGRKALLESLKDQGISQFILSAAPKLHLEEMMEHFDIGHLFHGVYGLDHHHADSKVHLGQRLLDEHTIDLSETLLVGDTDHDLEVGRHLNVDVLLVGCGHQDMEYLQTLHPHVIMP